ncbi:hypothetical protein WIS52_23190 [Pseudonocardia nematodicida]|uniref:Uncharacterized protein n=1 Tax=Pseudonocardia nematodicida TaxID=1206997 RepID=A0ABV1KGS9_9PSEU
MADHIHVNVNVSQTNAAGSEPPAEPPNLSFGRYLLIVIGVLIAIGVVAELGENSPAAGALVVLGAIGAAFYLMLGRIRAHKDEQRALADARLAVAHATATRTDIESRATADAAGGCMWCGLRDAHRAENGHPVHPRDWHALEVEEAVRAATGAAPAARSSGLPAVPPQMTESSSTLPSRSTPPGSPADAGLLAQLRYSDTGECLWCGSPVEHRTETGRVIHPARFHQAEYEAERDRH